MVDDLESPVLSNTIARGPAMGEREILHIPVGVSLADAERSIIFATLRHCGGNKTRAAALLGVSLKTLYNRLNAYRAHGIEEAELPATN
jgi:two-component system, NtrC family, response regulator HydG